MQKMIRQLAYLGCLRCLACLCCAGLLAISNALAATPLSFPHDFGAHPQFQTEWWYVTGWLERPQQAPIGFQITFFRSKNSHDLSNPSRFAAHQFIFAHAALSDPAEGRLIHTQKRARAGFDLADAKIGDTGLKLDDWTLERLPDGRYQAQIHSAEFDLELTLKPMQSTFLQGDQGYSRKGPNLAQSSYYYSEPQLQTSAKLTRKGKQSQWQGKAWLDHEWANAVVDPNASGWDWLGINLADGSALMAFQMRSKDGSQLWSHASLRPATGPVQHFSQQQVRFVAQRQWQSPRTATRYPVAQELHLQQGEKTIIWQIEPLQNDQEFDARSSIGILYWEGAVRVWAKGQPEQTGQGYLELTGYDKPVKL